MTMIGEPTECEKCGLLNKQPELSYDDDDHNMERGFWTCKGCGRVNVYLSDDDDEDEDDSWLDSEDDDEDDEGDDPDEDW